MTCPNCGAPLVQGFNLNTSYCSADCDLKESVSVKPPFGDRLWFYACLTDLRGSAGNPWQMKRGKGPLGGRQVKAWLGPGRIPFALPGGCKLVSIDGHKWHKGNPSWKEGELIFVHWGTPVEIQ